MKMNKWILTAAVVAVQMSAFGQEEKKEEFDAIATDRPDITESAQITPLGWFQYEGGYQFSNSKESYGAMEVKNRHQYEQVLRFGISEKFEVRAVINSNTERTTSLGIVGEDRRTGTEPITVGFKYNLIEGNGAFPQTTWHSHLSLPWLVYGGYVAPYQSNIVYHEQRLMMEKGITDRFGLATNIGLSGGLAGSNGFINEGMFSLAAGYDLRADFGIFLEYFSEFTWGGNVIYATPYVDGGFTKLLSNDLQLDIYAGYDLSTTLGARLPSTGFFFGTGVSYRLPLAQKLMAL